MEKKIVPIPINRSKAEFGAVPILSNYRSEVIGAALTTVQEKKIKVRAVPVNYFGNKRKTGIALILIGILWLGTSPLLAGETAEKESFWKQAGSIEKRGLVNFLSLPLEFRKAAITETKAHPKAWPVTYVPRLFTNLATRLASSVNDFIVLPLSSAATHDTTPLTRRFDMPDYAWQKE